LPWELYVALALNKVAVVSLYACKHCEHLDRVTVLFRKIKETMSTAFYREHFLFSETGSDERILSRREALHAFREKGRLAAGDIFSGKALSAYGALFFRKYLVKRLCSTENERTGCSWMTPVVHKNCWGCGLCASECPNRAMTVTETDRRLQLIHIPWRCTGCDRCRRCCPEKSLEHWRFLDINTRYLQQIRIDTEFTYCPKCQKTMKAADDGYFCYYCGHTEGPVKAEA
jgi:ferredoxin